jgi:hypothetical protein
MGKVYRVSSVHGNGVEYFNTARDADRCKPGGEGPESVICADAAGECNRLERYCAEEEKLKWLFRYLLEELRDICPTDVIHGTEIGRRVNKVIADNPLPPADAANRDGQRSYGTG